jgi:hypothetical protein
MDMPLYHYSGEAFPWSEIEPYVVPAFAGYGSAARSDFLRAAEELGAPDALIDLLDSLNEGRQYAGLDDLRRDLVAMGHVTEG